VNIITGFPTQMTSTIAIKSVRVDFDNRSYGNGFRHVAAIALEQGHDRTVDAVTLGWHGVALFLRSAEREASGSPANGSRGRMRLKGNTGQKL
jgi:hypothetical protein